MLVTSESPGYAEVNWTGVETLFALANFICEDKAHISVKYRTADDAVVLLTDGVHLTLSRNSLTGAITALPGLMPAAPGVVIFERVTPAVQAVSFENLVAYAPSLHEKLHTRAALVMGELRRMVNLISGGNIPPGSGLGLPLGGVTGEFLTKASNNHGDAIWADSVRKLGVNTAPSGTNKLAVKSDAVLLSHDDVTPGSGNMRAVMNKASAAKTASLLFQNNTSGRAEVGLTGDDKLHLKVSADGSAWVDAVTIEPTGALNIAASASEITAAIRVDGQSGGASAVNISRWSNDNGGVLLNTIKSRGTSPGSYTAAQSGDLMGAYAFYASTGSTVVVSGYLRSIVSGTVSGGAVPSEFNFFTTPVGGSLTPRLIISNAGNLVPATDNAYTCGQNGLRWSSVWAANGTIQTSDARDKDVIGGLDFAGAMVDAVAPVLFRWKVGGNDVRSSETETMTLDDTNEVPAIEVVPKPGVRAHSGFIAQDIKAAMDAAGVDFGAWGLEEADDPDSRQFMRPDQLIAVLWAALKETRAEVAVLRAELNL